MLKFIKSLLGLDRYISALDQFIHQFRRTHPTLSASQQQEKTKYTKIYALRDDPTLPAAPQQGLWNKF